MGPELPRDPLHGLCGVKKGDGEVLRLRGLVDRERQMDRDRDTEKDPWRHKD